MKLLKSKILQYMESNKITSSAVSTKALVSPGVVHNIIHSDNANPTIDSVIKIANLMGCSLDQLVDDKTTQNRKNIILDDLMLLKSITSFVCLADEIRHKSYDDYCNIVEEIYAYCQEQKIAKVDKNFAQWYIKKYFL